MVNITKKLFLNSTKLKIVWIKITTFFKRRVSIKSAKLRRFRGLVGRVGRLGPWVEWVAWVKVWHGWREYCGSIKFWRGCRGWRGLKFWCWGRGSIKFWREWRGLKKMKCGKKISCVSMPCYLITLYRKKCLL